MHATRTTPVKQRYTVKCACGHAMRVKKKHLGRMCRCTKCRQPIFVTRESVSPKIKPFADDAPRHFKADEVPVHWRPGDRFMETYEVLAQAGKGGMGVVHRIRHKGWGIDLAVKTPKPDLLPLPQSQEQFERECETWVNLDPHPNVAECFYVRRLGGIPRIFMEYVDGGSLTSWIRKGRLYSGNPRETLAHVLDVGIQTAWGLAHAHKRGLVHQDVKPGNTLMTQDGRVKVTDFGLVRALGAFGSGPGDVGSSSGTPPYSAPEHREQVIPDPRSDIWSWGASMMEILLGGLRWKDSDSLYQVFDTYRSHGLSCGPIPEIPDNLAQVIATSLADDPSDRPEDMAAIVDMLLTVYEEAIGQPYARPAPTEEKATADTLNNRAVSLLDLGKGEEADSLWAKALELDSRHVETIHNRTLHQWRTGRITDMAQLHTSRALCQERSDSWLPRYLMGSVLLEWGDTKTALGVINGIPDQDRERRPVLFAIAKARECEGKDRRPLRDFQAHFDPVTAVSISSDGWYAVSGSSTGSIKIWEASMGRFHAALQGHRGPVHALCMTPDEKVICSASADKTVKLWNAATGKCLHTLSGHTDAVRSVAISDNGRVAVSASTDQTLRIWDTHSGECKAVLTGHSAGINSIDMSTCGRYAVTGGRDKTVKYWDLTKGKCLRTLDGHKHRIHSVCLAADRSFALSASRDSSIRMWNLDTGACMQTYRGHRTEAYQVALSHDQQYLLSGSRLGTIKLWDRTSGQCIRSFQGSAPLALSRDGRYAVSGEPNGVIRLWAISCDQERHKAPFVIARKEER